VSWWRLRQYFAARSYGRKIGAIVNSLAELDQEFVSIAHCRDAYSWVALSHREARAEARARESLIESDTAIGEVLSRLIHDAEGIVDQLADLSKV
jgi:hypothetical protein